MASGNSADSFLDLLQQSGLVPDDQMLGLREEYGDERAKPDGARKLAEELVKREVLTRWQADMLLKGKHRGFHLGAHRILRPLGQGGMSKVFLAEHEMMRRRCAIKVLPSKYQADPDLLGRFHLEARAIAALDHRHIVRAYDFNKDVRYGKVIHYLVMEYVDGPDLRRLIEENGPLDYRKTADFIRQAAEGLSHAHKAGFVHRDIKPANLLVDQEGVLKILDLGLARFTFEGEQPWQASEGEASAVGTADYVAPEQVADSRNVDGRADIYGLGLTFYFLLTGRRPFPKSTLPELLMAHRKEQPEPISKFRPDVPLELIEIVDRMIAKEPIRRFQTAGEVADKLQTWLEESGGGDYSRISALMAAAMRSKQPSDSDGTKPTPKEAEASVLELASLDEDNKSAASAKKPAVESKPAAEGKSLPVSKPLSARPPRPPLKRAKLEDNLPSSPNIRTDVLAELFPVDQDAALQPEQMLAPASESGQFAAASVRRPVGPLDLLKSPWFWTAMVWLVFAILLLFILFRPDSDARSREAPPVEVSEQAGGGDNGAEPSASAPSRSKPLEPGLASPEKSTPGEAPSAEPVEPEPPAVDARSGSESSPNAPLPDEAIKPAEPKPESKSEPSEPAPEPAKPAPDSKDKSPPEESKSPTEKPIDTIKLLAGIEEISLRFRSSDPDPASKLNLTISRQATDALKQLGIKEAEKAADLMLVDVKISRTAALFSVELDVKVGCLVPGRPQHVVVWKHFGRIAAIPAQKLRSDQVLRVLRMGAREFFDRFTDDVRKARVDAKFK